MKEGWEYKTLGEVANIIHGKNQKNVLSDDGEYPIYGSGGTIMGYSKEYLCSAGSTLLGRKGSINNPRFIEENFWNVDTAFGISAKDNYYSKFIYYFCKNKDWNKLNTGTTLPSLTQSIVKSQIIPIPSLDEQRRIVSYLDSSFKLIDEIKEKAQKSLSEAKALFQSALAEAMEPKEGWEEKTLGEIATEMYRGSGIKRDQITPVGIPCLRYGEIYTTYNYSFDECVSHTEEAIISPKKYFEKGDILFAITGESVEDIGKCIAYTGNTKCLLGGDIVAMKHKQYPQFLAYALSTKEAIRQKGLGKVKLKVVHTNIPALKTIRIYLPTIETQKQIVSHLDKLSSNVKQMEERYKKIVEECDALKQAMLRDVFE